MIHRDRKLDISRVKSQFDGFRPLVLAMLRAVVGAAWSSQPIQSSHLDPLLGNLYSSPARIADLPSQHPIATGFLAVRRRGRAGCATVS